MISLALACLSLGIWICVLAGRGGFWRVREQDESLPFPPGVESADVLWPSVLAIVPARDDAQVIGGGLPSLLDQTYRGAFSVLLLDDQSVDGTVEVARTAAHQAGREDRLSVHVGEEGPRGWSGPLWAARQGLAQAEAEGWTPDLILISDAGLVYAPDMLQRLVVAAEARGLSLVSVLPRMGTDSFTERWLAPALVYLRLLRRPLAWANDPGRRTAAAGACILLRRDALDRAGGLEAIRGAADPAMLARLLKTRGPIWVGLTNRVSSLRSHASLGEMRRLAGRVLFSGPDGTGLALAGAVALLGFAAVSPPLLLILGSMPAQAVALAAWGAMIVSLTPVYRFHGPTAVQAAAGPAVGAVFLAFGLGALFQRVRSLGARWSARLPTSLHGSARIA